MWSCKARNGKEKVVCSVSGGDCIERDDTGSLDIGIIYIALRSPLIFGLRLLLQLR